MKASELRGWRLKKNLTQEEAAEAHGVSQEYWAMLESGTRDVPDGFKLAAGGKPRASKGRRGPRGSYGPRA